MTLTKKELGKLIKEARNIKSESTGVRFTQADLGESVGKSRSYIGDIESGRIYPNYTLLSDIASACGVSISYFDENQFLKEAQDLETQDKKSLSIKEEPTQYSNIEFTSAESAIKYILSQPAIMGFGGFNINKMSDEDIIDFANDLLDQLKLLSYKYNK